MTTQLPTCSVDTADIAGNRTHIEFWAYNTTKVTCSCTNGQAGHLCHHILRVIRKDDKILSYGDLKKIETLLRHPEFLQLATTAEGYNELCNWVFRHDNDMYSSVEIEEQVADAKLDLDRIESKLAELCGLKELLVEEPEPENPTPSTDQPEKDYDLRDDIICGLICLPFVSGLGAAVIALMIDLWDRPITWGHLISVALISLLLTFSKLVLKLFLDIKKPVTRLKFLAIQLSAVSLIILSVYFLLKFVFKLPQLT